MTDPEGVGLLLRFTATMTWIDVAWQIILATVGLAALAAACQGFLVRAMPAWERTALAVAGDAGDLAREGGATWVSLPAPVSAAASRGTDGAVVVEVLLGV